MERHDILRQRKVGESFKGGISRRTLLKCAAFVGFWPAAKLLLEPPLARAGTARPQYNPDTDPFQLNQQLRSLAERLGSGTANRKMIVQRLFDALKVKGTEGIRTVRSAGRPPRTAIETLNQGGDCTEFATLVISLFKEMRMPGGAMVVHFKNAPPRVDHMVPYAEIDQKRLVVDLQGKRLGSTQQGEYSILMTLDYEQAAAMYHREWGDYLRDKGRWKKAITAYKRALSLCEEDGYVHQNVAVLYGRTGNDGAAKKHFKRAGELDPARYSERYFKRVFIEEKNKGVDALNANKPGEARGHLQAALDSGHKIKPKERKQIERTIASCDRMVEQQRANKAFNEGRFEDAIGHFQESLDAAKRQVRLGGKEDRQWNRMMKENIEICRERIKKKK